MGISAAVIGASGFAGTELLRLLQAHPDLEVTHAAAHTKVGQAVSSVYPSLGVDLTFCAIDEALGAHVDVVFASLPHAQSMSRLANLPQRKVIDLGGDFRLDDPSSYERWYGQPHVSPGSLKAWTYGLTEINRSDIALSDRVANPGCYAAASLLALAPLVQRGHITGHVHIDGKSGVSGAGRAGGEGFDYSSANENTRAYSVTGHKHIAEIEQELAKVGGSSIIVSFVPHLVPMTRGIVVTCVSDSADGATQEELIASLEEFYASERFIRVLGAGSIPETKRLSGTNFAEVTVRKDERTNKVIAIASLDNLGKGAAGQAVQNANVMLGLDEASGLDHLGMVP